MRHGQNRCAMVALPVAIAMAAVTAHALRRDASARRALVHWAVSDICQRSVVYGTGVRAHQQEPPSQVAIRQAAAALELHLEMERRKSELRVEPFVAPPAHEQGASGASPPLLRRDGYLPAEAILAALQVAEPSLARCAVLLEPATVDRSYYLDFRVDREGAARNVYVVATDFSSADDPDVAACFRQALAGMRLPRPIGGPLTVRTPLFPASLK